MPNFRAIKISRGTTQPGYAGTTSNLQIVSNTPKTPYLIKLPKKIFAKIFLPKKFPRSKISNSNKSFYHPCHLKSVVPPLGDVQKKMESISF